MCCTLLCACVMNLAACTGDAAQSLLRHGMAECLRREPPQHRDEHYSKGSCMCIASRVIVWTHCTC